MFNLLFLSANERGICLEPKIFISDFESAFIKSVSLFFNDSVKHYGCHFHYTQCLQKNIAELGLKNAYFIYNSWFKLFTSIPFVEENKMEQAFNIIVEMKPVFDLETDPKVNSFLAYFRNTWLSDSKKIIIIIC